MDDLFLGRILLAAVLIGAGILLVWMARSAASGRLRRNQFAGIRVPTTMASDEAWTAAHVRAERPTALGGFVSIAAGFFALLPVSATVLGIGVTGSALAVLGFLVYGARVGRRAAAQVSSAPED